LFAFLAEEIKPLTQQSNCFGHSSCCRYNSLFNSVNIRNGTAAQLQKDSSVGLSVLLKGCPTPFCVSLDLAITTGSAWGVGLQVDCQSSLNSDDAMPVSFITMLYVCLCFFIYFGTRALTAFLCVSTFM